MEENTEKEQKDLEHGAAVRPALDLHYIRSASAGTCGNRIQNVAAYIRVSTDQADQENSYETQERYFYRTITKNPNWKLVGVYSDYGISGTCREKRTGFCRLVRHCREGKIDRILCKSISRFARNAADFAQTIHLLHESHVTVFFEKENLDTADPQNEFILNILGAFAQEESRSISSNLMMGNRMRNRSGEVRNVEMYGYRFNGKTVVCRSGYRYQDVEAVEAEAAVIRRIFLETAAKKSFASIARGLNRDEIPAPDSAYSRMRRKHPRKGQLYEHLEDGWTGEAIARIVRSERYAGDVRVQKRYTVSYLTHQMKKNRGEVPQYEIKNHHPAIVDRKLYENVRNVLENRETEKNRRPCREYPFSGRLVCGGCGRFYHVRNYRKKTTWFCPTSRRRNGIDACAAEPMEEDQVAELVRRAANIEADAAKVWDETCVQEEPSGYHELIGRMIRKMEALQDHDGVEETRSIYKSRLAALGEDRRNMQKEAEWERLRNELDCLEQYWEELERDFSYRETAILWMKTLPKGYAGLQPFLDGIAGEHFRAFVLDIAVGPEICKVRWFDGTCTEVSRDCREEAAYGC